MKTYREQWQRIQPHVVPVALAVVGVHLADASLFHISAPFVERLITALASLAVTAGAVFAYRSASQAVRGVIALTFGLPAFLFGGSIHASHVVQVGFKGSDFTGIPMLVAGAVLCVAGTILLVRLIPTWWHRLFLIPPGLAITFFLLFPIGVGIFAANVARVPCCNLTPADRGFAYEDVTFDTEQGLTLSAWYIPSQNGAAIITVHGAGKNRATTMDAAAVLAGHGYGVLMVDLEGFGDSEGRANAFGWVGARDIDAAVDYLSRRADVDPRRIGGLGLSMGGEVLIQAAAQTPGLAAIVAEGASGRTAADFGEMKGAEYDYVGTPLQTVIGATMTLISGESQPPPLKEMASRIGPKPVLLITADIPEEIELDSLYVAVGGPSFQIWTIPEDEHISALRLHPQEYEQRVIEFFDRALLGDIQAVSER